MQAPATLKYESDLIRCALKSLRARTAIRSPRKSSANKVQIACEQMRGEEELCNAPNGTYSENASLVHIQNAVTLRAIYRTDDVDGAACIACVM